MTMPARRRNLTGRLAAGARDLHELGHVVGHLAAVALDQGPGRALQ